MLVKSNQWIIELKMQQASQYMVFSTFGEAVLVLFNLKVRITGQILLFCDVLAIEPSLNFEERSMPHNAE